MQNWNVTVKFKRNISLGFQWQNWELNKLEYNSGKPSAIQAQPRAQVPSALSLICI